MSLTGWVDGATFTRVSGWATGAVTIHLNGGLVTTVTPSIPRADLREGFGFDVPLDPLRFVQGKNQVTVTFADTGAAVGKGGKTIELETSPEFVSGQSVASIPRGYWTIDHITKVDDRLSLNGWCVAPAGLDASEIFANGERLRFTSRRDTQLQAQTWLPPEMVVHRYEAEFRFAGPVLRVGFGEDGRSFDPHHDWSAPREESLQAGRDRIRRVSGGFDPFKFDVQGMTNADRMLAAYDRHGSTSFTDATVLDWGVGAGRVARFLAPSAGAFHGVDVDADNLAWCRDNLTGAYTHIEVDPPTPLAAKQFDFIYGISVVTHLTRDYEKAWLKELRRLIKDDGVVALSIHGPVSLMVMGLCHWHARLATEGFVDLGENKILEGRVPDGYYRNVAQSYSHLQRVWGEFFTISEIMQGAIGLQDLVILRPR